MKLLKDKYKSKSDQDIILMYNEMKISVIQNEGIPKLKAASVVINRILSE